MLAKNNNQTNQKWCSDGRNVVAGVGRTRREKGSGGNNGGRGDGRDNTKMSHTSNRCSGGNSGEEDKESKGVRRQGQQVQW